MRIAICRSCSEVVDPATAGVKDGHLYCRDCAKIHDAVMPKVCHACNRNRAIMEHKYNGVCFCERCADKMEDFDEDVWEEPTTY